MEKYNNLKNKKVLILGFSKTGIACAKYLQSQGANVFVSENRKKEEKDEILINELTSLNIKIEFSSHSEEFINGAEFCILSPSIPFDSEIIQRLENKKVEYFSDIEFIAKFNNDKIIAITGTNGKTTTTALISHILSEKYNAPYCGNIGISPVEYIKKNPDYYVIEASSYQLHYANTIKPFIGIFCNLTPDHILWHKTIENYFEAKAKMFKNMTEKQNAILNYDDKMLFDLGQKIDANVFYFSLKKPKNTKNFAYLNDNKIFFEEEEIININKLNIVGNHNYQNVMCAIIAAKITGLDSSIIKKALTTFKAIENRLEYVRTIENTDYYNDSKATNPEASIVAINSFENKKVVLIAGGRDKKTSLKDFIKAIKEKISKVVLIGEATQRFREELYNDGYLNIVNSKTLEEAIDIASLDKPDVVLLSPACASFDMFESYEKRGEAFKKYVLSKK